MKFLSAFKKFLNPENGLSEAAIQASEDAVKVDLNKLIQLRFRSSQLSLGSQKKAYATMAGNHISPFKGRGLNFEEVRHYQPGDDVRNIDWNVTARTDKVHTKVFKEERERPVYIIADFRSTMFFGSRHCYKSVTAAKAAALFAWAGGDNHNSVGGLVFNDNEQYQLRPRAGHQGILRFLKLITDFHNSSDTVANASPLNLELLFARLRKVIQPGSIILLASDYKHFDNTILNHLRYLAKHNDLLTAFIYDPLETMLPPPGKYKLSDGLHSYMIDTHDQKLQNLYQLAFKQQDQAIQQFCYQNSIHLIRLPTNASVPERFIMTLGKENQVHRIASRRH